MFKKISITLLSSFSLPSAVLTTITVLENNNYSQFIKTDKQQVENVYFLGDSLIDNGVIVNAVNQMIDNLNSNCVFKLFMHQDLKNLSIPDFYYQQTSLSNGKVLSEVVADKFNIDIIPAWDVKFNFLGSTFETSNIGNNYAISAAKAYDEQKEDEKTIDNSSFITSNFNQINEFHHFIFDLLINNFSILKQGKSLVKQHSLKQNDVIIIQNGGNDLCYLQRHLKRDDIDSIDQQINDFLDVAINNLQQTIVLLIENNAKKIVITNCSATEEFFITNKTQKINLVQLYNAKLQTMVDNLLIKYPNLIKIYDIYNSFIRIKTEFIKANKSIGSALPIGFETIAQSIIFGKNDEVEMLKQKLDKVEIDNFFYLDASHPTKLVHKTIGEEIYEFIINWN